MKTKDAPIEIELENGSHAATKAAAAIWAQYNDPPISYFFVETTRDEAKQHLHEFFIGYSKDFPAWVTKYRCDEAAYLLVLRFEQRAAGRNLWLLMQEVLQKEGHEKIGAATLEKQKHTFPRYAIRARKLAKLISQLVTSNPEFRDAKVFMEVPQYMLV